MLDPNTVPFYTGDLSIHFSIHGGPKMPIYTIYVLCTHVCVAIYSYKKKQTAV